MKGDPVMDRLFVAPKRGPMAQAPEQIGDIRVAIVIQGNRKPLQIRSIRQVAAHRVLLV